MDNLDIEEVETTAKIILDQAKESIAIPEKAEQYTADSLYAYRDAAAAVLKADPEKTSLAEAKKLADDLKKAAQGLVELATQVYWDNLDMDKSEAGAEDEYTSLIYAFDEDNETLWHTPYTENYVNKPATIVFDKARAIHKFRYVPRQSGLNGVFKAFTMTLVDADGKEHVYKVTDWVGDNNAKELDFGKTIRVAKVILLPTETYGDTPNTYVSAAEMQFLYKLRDNKVATDAYDKALAEAEKRQVSPVAIQAIQAEMKWYSDNNLLTPNSVAALTEKLNALKKTDTPVEQEKVLTDPATGVTVKGTNFTLAHAEKVQVEKSTVQVLKDSSYLAYDISLADKDGKLVQVAGQVQVTIPATGKVAQVYYVLGDMLEKLAFSQEGDKVSFDVTHFSQYALVFEEANNNPSTPNAQANPTNPAEQQVESLAQKGEAGSQAALGQNLALASHGNAQSLPRTGSDQRQAGLWSALGLGLLSILGLSAYKGRRED